MLAHPWHLVQQLASTSSRTEKQRIIEQAAAQDHQQLFAGMNLALNSFVTFGIRQVPDTAPAGSGVSWSEFQQLTQQLASRELTGNAARDAVAQLHSGCTADQWLHWYRPILLRDLRCGVTEKTINTAVKAAGKPEFMVPVFSVQLAQDFELHPAHQTGEKLVDFKLDGVRCITVLYPTGQVQQFSRNGKALENFAHICQQLAPVAAQLTEPWVLDGEIVSASFQQLMSQLYRKTQVNSADAVYWIFDWLPLWAFVQARYDEPQLQRRQQLTHWHQRWAAELPAVHCLPATLLDLSTSAGQQLMQQLNQQALEQGVEGIMLKNPAAAYECRRSSNWLKLKPTITVDLQVQALEPGTGKNAGHLGALVCAGTSEHREIQVHVGSGFTDAQRAEIWQHQQLALGQWVEVQADAVTQNQDGSYSLRFPRFVRWRSWTPGEKI